MSSRGAPGPKGPTGPRKGPAVTIVKHVWDDYSHIKQDAKEDVKMETKKLGWFDRWFMRKSREAWDNYRQEKEQIGQYSDVVVSSPARRNSINTRNSIDMSLVRADGGWIVQFQSWDSRREDTDVFHHVIPDSEDFGQRLSEIITTQCLRT